MRRDAARRAVLREPILRKTCASAVYFQIRRANKAKARSLYPVRFLARCLTDNRRTAGTADRAWTGENSNHAVNLFRVRQRGLIARARARGRSTRARNRSPGALARYRCSASRWRQHVPRVRRTLLQFQAEITATRELTYQANIGYHRWNPFPKCIREARVGAFNDT